jgi:hypothetical protein
MAADAFLRLFTLSATFFVSRRLTLRTRYKYTYLQKNGRRLIS